MRDLAGQRDEKNRTGVFYNIYIYIHFLFFYNLYIVISQQKIYNPSVPSYCPPLSFYTIITIIGHLLSMFQQSLGYSDYLKIAES